MIITLLQGGVGNQLFQYSFGRNLAIKFNTVLKLDLVNYQGNDSYREYGLHKFNIVEKFASNSEILKIKYHSPALYLKIKYLLKNKRINKSYLTANQANIYTDEKIQKDEVSNLTIGNDIYLDGYWAHENYFKDIKTIIKKDLTFKEQCNLENQGMLEQIKTTNSVSIHYRRGDYHNPEHFEKFGSVCDEKYYSDSIKYICKHITNPVFYLFSDEIEWVKSNINLPCKTVCVDCTKNSFCTEDIRLMSQCKHNIMANSTFSWWGAWLNANPNKIVIAPKKDCEGFICDGWVTV